MQLYENGQLVKTRIYCGMYEKETFADSAVKEYCYISGGGGVTAVLINQDMYYLRRDVQGTITGLVNQNDTLVEEYSYDAWGRRRNPTNWAYDSVPQPQYMHRGYTFHEMLDEFGLINMNGRCYDPVVGRFLSPDIVVQNPNNTQCYNRYSYAVNNPLKYTDPSGWSWTPIQAANHANMMAMTMTMRLQDNFHPTVIRSGSSSRGNGFLFGSNAIVFQNAEATLEMALGEIAHILSSVFGQAGLFGNPGDDDNENGDPKYDGKEFYNFTDMLTFMYETSKSKNDGVELRAYVLENRENQEHIFYLMPWFENQVDRSENYPENLNIYTSIGFFAVADIHTHNSDNIFKVEGFSMADMNSFNESNIREMYVIQDDFKIYAMLRDDLYMCSFGYYFGLNGDITRYYRGILLQQLPY